MITFYAAGSKAVEFTVVPVKPCPMPGIYAVLRKCSLHGWMDERKEGAGLRWERERERMELL